MLMLVFWGQSCSTEEMSDDKETIVRDEEVREDDQTSQSEAGPAEAPVMPLPPPEPVPPPPSAPAEFLDSQWLGSLPQRVLPIKLGGPITPPPPSAPGEFLSAQWMNGEGPDSETVLVDVSNFERAVPQFVESSDRLESLAAELELPDGAAAIGDSGAAQDGHDSTPARIREVALSPGEDVSMVFLPDEGVVDSVPKSGQALILTNHRLIAFRGVEGFRDTHMAIASEISQCSVRTGQRNWGAILQGLMIMVGGAFLYLVVGYWLAGQVSGPNVPVLNIDVAPLISLLIILVGLFILASNYFTRPAGALIFHGEGVEIAFPFRSSLGLTQVYDFVDRVYAARRDRDAGAHNAER